MIVLIAAFAMWWVNDLAWQWGWLFALAAIADSLCSAIARGVRAKVAERRQGG